MALVACGGGDSTDTPSVASAPGATAGVSTSPSTASVPVSTSIDPAAEPSIDGSYAVGTDGRRLALVCWGEGSPTVVLETGGPNIEEWTGSGIVEELAGSVRVCTYDRAGTGASDAAPDEKRDADDVVADARAVLEAANVAAPFVLVGRSFGGMVVTHFADVAPTDVLGVVVLDTPAPSAEFTEENEPDLVWDAPGNTEHLDVVHGFENRFAAKPPKFDLPMLLITPDPGEASAENESFWLQVSPQAKQVELSCGEEPTEGPCATQVAAFVAGLSS
jgi:pimeloyl-ACP methyl ester carboxylesterase